MSKERVRKAPKFDLEGVDYSAIAPHLQQYDTVDDSGKYLHWDQLKWRVPRGDATNIWLAVKFKRSLQSKFTSLIDEVGNRFGYCIPRTLEAKLHQVVKIAGGSVGAVAREDASEGAKTRYLVSSLRMEEAITSAQLEGAVTTRKVAKKMLEEEREPVDEDERMIVNNFRLLRYAEKIKGEPLSVDLILELHQIAIQGTTGSDVIPGTFRQEDDVYVDDGDGGIAHQPPKWELMPERMQFLCDFANEDHSNLGGSGFIAPVVKAIILHFMLGYEHPFRDGNGRTARALFYWFMLKEGYDLFKYVSISKHLKEDPKGYGLSYLYTETDQNDLTYFIDYQLTTILNAFSDLNQYLEEKNSEYSQIMTVLKNSSLNKKLNFVQRDLLKKGTKDPGRVFTVKEVSNSYEIVENTARTYLNKLVELKLLLYSKSGRTMLYLSPSDLKARLTDGESN